LYALDLDILDLEGIKSGCWVRQQKRGGQDGQFVESCYLHIDDRFSR